jgi:ribose/xylose/arabinose/galactoside ABC-type transport system permease subunit
MTGIEYSNGLRNESRRRTLGSALAAIFGAREFAIFAFLIVMSLAIGWARPTFFGGGNLLAMGRQMSELTIMGVAMTFLLTAQELDLSVGSIYGLCALTMTLITQNLGVNLWLSLLIVLMLAAVIGVVNGLITTRGRIPAFIVTLGMLYILRGIALVESPWPVSGLENPSFFAALDGKIGQVPIQIFWMIGFVIVGSLVLRRTTFGYHVRATGSNRAAAELSGIRVRRVKVVAFVLTALSAGFAGAMSFTHLGSASPLAGTGYELTVIAAVVIGGTALFGGEGTVIGTFLGAALLTIMRNGLVQLGGEGRLQDAFLGGIIIVAVLIHTHLNFGRSRK